MTWTIPTIARGTIVNKEISFTPSDIPYKGLATDSVGGNQIEVCSGPLNIAIPDNNTTGINHTINVPTSGTIVDANILLSVTHNYVGDLVIRVTKDSNSALLIDRPFFEECSGNDIDDNISDDEASASFEGDCQSGGGGTQAYTPGASYYSLEENNDPLEIFDSMNSNGNWTINVQDRSQNTAGALQRWCVQLTLGEAPATPTPTPTFTKEPLPTNTPTSTPTGTKEPLPTNTPTSTPTGTQEPLPTNTPTPTPEIPPTITPTRTPPVGQALNYLPLIAQSYRPALCIDTEVEPNNNSANANANPPICQSTIINGHIPLKDSGDYYRIVLSTQAVVNIALFNIATQSDFDLYLYDSVLNELESSSQNGSVDEFISRRLPIGTYYVRVYPDPTELGGERTYQLRWSSQ